MKFKYLFIMILLVLPISTFALDSENEVALSNCSDENSARFVLGTEELKVKFIGIQSEALVEGTENDEVKEVNVSDYVCSLLKNAKKIKLVYEPDINNKDKYGRTYSWVFVDDILLQENLVQKGYAKVAFLYDDYKYNDELLSAEKTAKEEKIGVWREKEEKSDPPSKNKKEKGFFDDIISFFSNIFESIVDFFEDLINNNF